MKKLPPYGKSLQDLQQKGLRPTNSIKVFMGNNAWKKGDGSAINYPERTLVLPPWICASSYTWPVKDCDILIFDSGYAEMGYIENLVQCLYLDGADIVRYVSPELKLTVYYKEV